jgi:hypothetical protein
VAEAVDLALAGGPWAALLGIILVGLRAIVSGQLVPRSTLDVLREQWEARLAESHHREEQWREAYQNEASAGDLRDGQVGRLMTYAETADRVLQSLPRKDT